MENMKLYQDLKKYLKTVSPYILVIVCMFFWIMWLTECGGRKVETKTEYKMDTIVQTVHDTTRIESPIYVPQWYEKKVYVNVPTLVYTPVDTTAILADYFDTYFYGDTLMDDTSAFIAVYDQVSQNKIGARQWTFINRRPTEIKYITMIEDCKKWNIGLGGFFGGSLERFDYGLGVIVTTNNRASYQAEYCFSDKSVRVGYYYNLRK
jgi:hypothetical protein